MAADINHAKLIESLGDAHEKRIVEALAVLEERITALLANAPLKNGKLFDLEWAIAARRDILKSINETFIGAANKNVVGYDAAVASAESMLKKYIDFTGIPPEVISALKRQSFRGFEDIGNTFLNDIANEVYQNTLTGRPVADSIKTIRQKVNGVYAQADQVEIQKLVDIANGGGSDAEDAIKKLKEFYASDKLGNNMRRYASQQVHDSLMQFDASLVIQASKEAGADKWKYYGSVIRDSRPFCKEHAGKVYTEAEIREIWQGDWAGKAPGDPFIVRGGYNCRHHWRPVYAEDVAGENVVSKQQKPTFEIPSKVNVTGSSDVFVAEMNKLSDDQIRLVNKLEKPVTLEDKPGSGAYYPGVMRLEADTSKRGGSIVRHEYGHHVDYMLSKTPLVAISTSDAQFVKAVEADRKALGLHRNPTKAETISKFKNELYDVVEKESNSGTYKYKSSVLKNDELGNFSDIVDALAKGDAYQTQGMFGHGKAYYKRSGSVEKEIFANLFAIRNTEFWGLAEKNFPSLTKRFDELIAEGLK